MLARWFTGVYHSDSDLAGSLYLELIDALSRGMRFDESLKIAEFITGLGDVGRTIWLGDKEYFGGVDRGLGWKARGTASVDFERER